MGFYWDFIWFICHRLSTRACPKSCVSLSWYTSLCSSGVGLWWPHLFVKTTTTHIPSPSHSRLGCASKIGAWSFSRWCMVEGSNIWWLNGRGPDHEVKRIPSRSPGGSKNCGSMMLLTTRINSCGDLGSQPLKTAESSCWSCQSWVRKTGRAFRVTQHSKRKIQSAQ